MRRVERLQPHRHLRGTPFTLGKWIAGYLEMGIQTPMAPGQSTKFISIINWIRRLSMKKSLSWIPHGVGEGAGVGE